MNPLDEPEVDAPAIEQYGAGWIQESWLWACDDCLHEALDDDENGVAGVEASCGSCDTAHEAREALMQHNVTCHGRRAFS